VSGGTVASAGRRGRRGSRFWRALPLAILLLISFFLLVVVTGRATRAALEARNSRRVEAGEAIGVRPWMTIPYIASTYGVPEETLFAALGLSATEERRRTPLRGLARREGRDLDADIAALNAVLDGRAPSPGRAPPQPTPARTPGARP
jgi:hypothetical protein